MEMQISNLFAALGMGGCCQREQASGKTPWAQQNVGDMERWASAVAGGGLLLAGLTRPMSLRGAVMAIAGGAFLYRGVTGHCSLYQAMGVDTREPRAAATAVANRMGQKVEKSVIIRQDPQALYRFWRKLENLPKVMNHLVSVEELGDRRSRWVAKAILGATVQWDAEIINDRPGEMISWRSIDGSDVDTAGSVHFESAGAAVTRLRVSLQYSPPGDHVGAAIAQMLQQGLEDKLEEDLQRFKQLMEAADESLKAPALAGGTETTSVATPVATMAPSRSGTTV